MLISVLFVDNFRSKSLKMADFFGYLTKMPYLCHPKIRTVRWNRIHSRPFPIP